MDKDSFEKEQITLAAQAKSQKALATAQAEGKVRLDKSKWQAIMLQDRPWTALEKLLTVTNQKIILPSDDNEIDRRHESAAGGNDPYEQLGQGQVLPTHPHPRTSAYILHSPFKRLDHICDANPPRRKVAAPENESVRVPATRIGSSRDWSGKTRNLRRCRSVGTTAKKRSIVSSSRSSQNRLDEDERRGSEKLLRLRVGISKVRRQTLIGWKQPSLKTSCWPLRSEMFSLK